jgi:hypothetical protein
MENDVKEETTAMIAVKQNAGVAAHISNRVYDGVRTLDASASAKHRAALARALSKMVDILRAKSDDAKSAEKKSLSMQNS